MLVGLNTTTREHSATGKGDVVPQPSTFDVRVLSVDSTETGRGGDALIADANLGIHIQKSMAVFILFVVFS